MPPLRYYWMLNDTLLEFHTNLVIDMTRPPVLYNSYIKTKNKIFIDVVSKIFIISELPFGIFRLPLFCKIPLFCQFLVVLYCLVLTWGCVVVFYYVHEIYYTNMIIFVFTVQCISYMVFGVIRLKKLQSFYSELNRFDKEIGCRPKTTKETIANLIHTVAMLLHTFLLYWLPHILQVTTMVIFMGPAPFIVCDILEVHFCGHLLSLLTPRLRLINYFMELPLSNSKINKAPNVVDFGFFTACSNKSLCNIENLMNLYHRIIKAYDYLIEAIKWQLVFSIVATFINNLVACFDVYLLIIKENGSPVIMVSYAAVSLVLMLPLFSPCILGDQIKKEVRTLRELLTSRLFENKMDKYSRSTARALLAWTETCDLSFSLLRMLDIDISLPFKFIGLLVTYLIILLQFQKVINP